MITAHYKRVLGNYLKWDCGDGIGELSACYDHLGPGPEEAMFYFESHGEAIRSCSDPKTLEKYWRGKKWRDWHLSEWRKGIVEGTLFPVEIKNELGMTKKDYKNLLGLGVY